MQNPIQEAEGFLAANMTAEATACALIAIARSLDRISANTPTQRDETNGGA